MEFRRASSRLNFFFDVHSWALLLDMPLDGSLDTHLQVLKTTCAHWGSKLAFPFQLDAHAFENNVDAESYWFQKLPGLRLLHYRKQSILISDLFEGYNPQLANQFLRRKLNLDQTAWGHLIYFAESMGTFVCSFSSNE